MSILYEIFIRRAYNVAIQFWERTIFKEKLDQKFRKYYLQSL